MKILLNSFCLLFFAIISTAHANDSLTKTSMTNTLGAHTKIISKATKIEMAKLKISSVNTAHKNMFISNNYIVGYPITDHTITINAQDQSALIKTLLNEKNYISLRRRCKNDYFIGIRFSTKNEKVEFALGIPCQQAIWAISVNSHGKQWGSVLNNAASNTIKSIFENNFTKK